MSVLQERESQTIYECWSQHVAGVLAWQWNLFETQYQVGLKIMEVALRIPGNPEPVSDERKGAAPQTGDELHRLESLALERARKGLAPPRELYEVPYRDRIDWSKFPGWARPIDPEVFQELGHEG
jgi:hypothetical protein